MRQGVRAMAGRLSWGLGDQAVSSLSNFAVGIVVARGLGVTGFGVFTLAWVTYGVLLNVSRGLATDPLVVRFSGAADERWRSAVARSSGTALLIGLGSGALSVLAGLALGGVIGWAFLGLGVVLPGLLVQDSWRYAFFAAGQGQKAFLNDIVWAAAMVPALFLAAKSGTVFAFVLAWGLSAALAAGYGALQSGVLPSAGGAREWVSRHRDLGSRYLVENVSNSGASQLRMYGLGAIAGLSAVGAIRGGELLLAPFLALLMGVSLVAVPEAARVLKRSPARLPAFCLVLGGGQAAAALVWGLGILLFLPDSLGTLVLGEVWGPAEELILPITLSVTGAGVVAGATAGLRALGAAKLSLRAQLFASAGYLGGGLAGAALGGALGASWGSTIAMWCGAAVWWWQLRVGFRQYVVPEPDQPEEMRTR
ncbi:MATE family efflux transporter [Prauserella endophytica]|uniref:O-antigen/teichoic acid export membrane protein n=1 Tax=Prauserella endophytica TaxID=1592324 RepID=A0ABY2SCQ3_9PSEU|nr:hypothetical protein [Prauserella endophytica]TKG73703.1 hypothetical protein FCN18_03910 [Prauserella endophytica]